jgi:hypothetical protein
MKGIALLSLLLCGCAISKPMYMPDGKQGYSISCDGSMNSIGKCFEKAGELCGSRGYNIVTKEGEIVPYGYAGGGFNANQYAANGAYVSQSGAFVNRTLMVQCRE